MLKVWKWLASKCVTEGECECGPRPIVKRSAEKLQASSKKLVEGSRRVCSRRLWNIHGVTGTPSQTGLACLARQHNNIATAVAEKRPVSIKAVSKVGQAHVPAVQTYIFEFKHLKERTCIRQATGMVDELMRALG